MHTGIYAGVLPFYSPLQNNSTSISIQYQHLFANDLLPLDELFNDWDAPLQAKKNNNIAIQSSRLDIGYEDKKWGYFGYTYRDDIYLSASRDFIDFVYLLKNNQDLNYKKEYQAYLESRGTITHGLTYSKSFKLKTKMYGQFHVGLGASLLLATDAQEGVLYGNIQALSTNEYNYNATLDYLYLNNLLYDLEIDKNYGYGYSLYAALEYQYKNFTTGLIINDFASQIYYSDIAYTEATVASDIKDYDEDGYVIYNPTLNGQEGYREYTQNLASKYQFNLNYNFEESTKVTLALEYYRGTYFPSTEIGHSFFKDIYNFISYESYFSMVGLGLKYKTFSLELKSNSLQAPSAISAIVSGAYTF